MKEYPTKWIDAVIYIADLVDKGKPHYMTVEEYVQYLLEGSADQKLIDDIARQTAMILKRKRVTDANRN